jgi:hypothetical protein
MRTCAGPLDPSYLPDAELNRAYQIPFRNTPLPNSNPATRGSNPASTGPLLTARATSGLIGITRRACFPGRVARGSAFPRKATCQVPASGLFKLVQGRRRAQIMRKGPGCSGTRASHVPVGGPEEVQAP